MSSKQITKPSIGLTRTMAWALILGYGLFLVGRTTFHNFKINKEIDTNQKVVESLEKKKKILQLSLFYYQSKSFQEIEARRRLNLKGKDEHVVALPNATTEPKWSIAANAVQSTTPNATTTQTPYNAWWNLFFGD